MRLMVEGSLALDRWTWCQGRVAQKDRREKGRERERESAAVFANMSTQHCRARVSHPIPVAQEDEAQAMLKEAGPWALGCV